MPATQPSFKYHLITFGCQMNKNDSERIAGILHSLNAQATDVAEEADLILMNSCSVRQTAEDRIYGLARNFTRLKEKNPRLIVGLTGCMAGRDTDGKIRKRLPDIDLFFPTSEIHLLPSRIAALRPELANTGEILEDYLKIQPLRGNFGRTEGEIPSSVQAFITLSTGCNQFCTYCVVPYARGLERYRPMRDVLDEVRRSVESGAIEITLLGQTVNRYLPTDTNDIISPGNPYKNSFAALLWEINQIPGVERIHFTAAHPLYMDDEVIDALALPKHLNYLHLPVQSGDNDILKKMNRKHTREQYLETIAKIKKRVPNIALGTDIIVGFCGETEEQFERTLELYRAVEFDISYHAIYSPRSGTLADKHFKDDVPREIKKERWQKLQALMEDITLAKNQRYVGQTLSVLAERIERGQLLGNSRELKLVRFSDPPRADSIPRAETGDGTGLSASQALALRAGIGKIHPVRITEAQCWILNGQDDQARSI